MKDLWQNYKMMADLCDVPRAGVRNCHLFPEIDSDDVATLFRGESVMEHSGSLANLITEMMMKMPQLFTEYDALTVTKVAQIHDIVEVIIGDIPDNGSDDHLRKTDKELELIGTYTSRLPVDYRQKVNKLYGEMITLATLDGRIMRIADKTEAILKLLYYESKGLYGNVYARDDFSEQDELYANIVHTGNCTDVWGYQLKVLMDDSPVKAMAPFFKLLMEATYDVRGKWFAWW